MSNLRVIPGSPDLVRFLAARFSPDQIVTVQRDGAEVMLQGIEAHVRNAARTWCALDAGGPVFMLGAMKQPDSSVAVWYMTTTATRHYVRACIQLWRRAVVEMLAEFGAVRVDVPPYIATARRMMRYGFTMAQPAPDAGGTVVRQCEITGQPRLVGSTPSNTMTGL